MLSILSVMVHLVCVWFRKVYKKERKLLKLINLYIDELE